MTTNIQIPAQRTLFLCATDVTHESKKYCVITIAYSKMNGTFYQIPFIIDAEDFTKINMNDWIYVGAKYIGYSYTHGTDKKTIYMHNVIMNNQHFQGKGAKITIDHINRIGQDNRKANLRLATQTKQNHNQKKRKRTTTLPDGCGVNLNEIPTGVDYRPANGSHGECFEVVIKENGKRIFREKTSRSKKMTLREKLDKAERILTQQKMIHPEWFKDRCLNGELSDNGKKLYKSYFEILKLAGIKDHFNIENTSITGNAPQKIPIKLILKNLPKKKIILKKTLINIGLPTISK